MSLRNRVSPHFLVTAIFSLVLPYAGCTPSPTIEKDGGFRVTYALRAAKPGDQQLAVKALQQRLDAFGAEGSVVAARGADQIEITLPGLGSEKFEQLQKLLVTPGKLEFRILARKGTHDALIEAATPAPTPADHSKGDHSKGDQPKDDQPKDDQPKGDQDQGGETSQTKWVRFDPTTLELPPTAIQRTVGEYSEVLVVLDANDVDSRLLESVSGTVDSAAQPAIAGRFTREGGQRMRTLTTDNAPQGNVYQSLGVILDDRLLVAPRIQEPFGDAFMLTGKFTELEVDFLLAVLRTGRLPVELDPNPVHIQRVTATPDQ